MKKVDFNCAKFYEEHYADLKELFPTLASFSSWFGVWKKDLSEFGITAYEIVRLKIKTLSQTKVNSCKLKRTIKD